METRPPADFLCTCVKRIGRLRKISGCDTRLLGARAKISVALQLVLYESSSTDLRNKTLMYTAIIRPVLANEVVAWMQAANSHLHTLQVQQKKFLRRIAKAPWYIRNRQLHDDLQVPMSIPYMEGLVQKRIQNNIIHPNLLVVAILKSCVHIS